ncbi:MAG: sugar transferase [Aureliella sp.]
MLKRLLEISLSAALLLALSLPFLAICVILKLTGEREVFYRQDRVGLGGKAIRLTKFVTMVQNSLSIGSKDITLKNDPRVLPIGKFLRKTKLNELPQLWDVISGKLSIVGWRPLMQSGFSMYPTEVQQVLLTIKPGLTGIGSLIFRDEEAIIARAEEEGRDLRACYREDIMPYKGAVEVWYVQNAGLWTDFKIMFGTGIAVLRPGWIGFYGWFKGLPMPESQIVREVLGLDQRES